MVSIFTNDPSLKEVAEKGLRVMNPVVLIVGWQMVSTNLFQSLGMVEVNIPVPQPPAALPCAAAVPDAAVLWHSWSVRGIPDL